MNEQKLNIFVVFYKDYQIDGKITDNPNIYKKIFSGAQINTKTPLLEGMIQDNTGDNISYLNKYLSEFTSLYWVSKNYQNLGNLSHIGFNHYRRMFKLEDIQDYENHDIICYENILGRRTTPQKSLIQQFNDSHDNQYMVQTIQKFKQFDPSFGDYIEKNIETDTFFPKVCFVMKVDIFKELSEKILVPLKFLPSMLNLNDEMPANKKRIPAFVGERLVSLFIKSKIDEGYEVKQVHIEEELI